MVLTLKKILTVHGSQFRFLKSFAWNHDSWWGFALVTHSLMGGTGIAFCLVIDRSWFHTHAIDIFIIHLLTPKNRNTVLSDVFLRSRKNRSDISLLQVYNKDPEHTTLMTPLPQE